MRSLLLTFIAVAAISASAHAQSTGAASEKRAAPPAKWDRRVLDTFFPDARKELVGERPKYAASHSSVGSGGGGGGAVSVGGSFTWSKLISADTLADEIKTLAPQLADDVKTQQSFIGGANKKSRKTLSMLATAFAIISEYDADAKWKDQAVGARDLFARAGFNCKAATEATFRETKQRSEDLAGLLRGEPIKTPTIVEAKNEWVKIANRAPLMSRLELAQRDRIAPWTSSAAEFKKNSTGLEHEAEIVAALAEVIIRPGFEDAVDEKYREYAKSLQHSAMELQTATKYGNYESAGAAAGNLTKACANCHGDFR